MLEGKTYDLQFSFIYKDETTQKKGFFGSNKVEITEHVVETWNIPIQTVPTQTQKLSYDLSFDILRDEIKDRLKTIAKEGIQNYCQFPQNKEIEFRVAAH